MVKVSNRSEYVIPAGQKNNNNDSLDTIAMRDTDHKIIKITNAAVLSSKRLENNRQQVVVRIVNIIEAATVRSITVWIGRRCDLSCYFPKVLFAAI